jgi:biotin carboxyl carrier protein
MLIGMKQSAKHYRVELQQMQLSSVSNEEGVWLEGEPHPVPITDGVALRSFSGMRPNGSQLPIYVEEGEGEHDYVVYLAGEAVHVQVVTPRDERLLALRKNTAGALSKAQMLTAPMPGLLKEILVSEGDLVEKGRSLCILEAMKMENEIKSPGRMIVKRVLAQPGTAVEKGTRLLELEPPPEAQ